MNFMPSASPKIVDTDHVAVGDLGSEDEFLLESIKNGAVAGQVRADHLQGDETVELNILALYKRRPCRLRPAGSKSHSVAPAGGRRSGRVVQPRYNPQPWCGERRYRLRWDCHWEPHRVRQLAGSQRWYRHRWEDERWQTSFHPLPGREHPRCLVLRRLPGRISSLFSHGSAPQLRKDPRL